MYTTKRQASSEAFKLIFVCIITVISLAYFTTTAIIFGISFTLRLILGII